MEEKKTNGTVKEKLFTKIPALYAWLIVGGASAVVFALQLILIFNA